MISCLRKTIVLLIFIVLELVFLFFFRNGDAKYLNETGQTFNSYLREHGGIEFLLAAYSRIFFRISFISWLLFSIALGFKEIRGLPFLISRSQLLLRSQLKISWFAVVTNVICFVILLGLFFWLQNPVDLLDNPTSFKSMIYALSPIVWGLYLFSICDLIFPVKKLISIAQGELILFFTVIIFTLLILTPEIVDALIIFWSQLLLTPTVDLASTISQIFGFDYQSLTNLNNGIPTFGTSQFSVQITPSCSGFEGMTLIALLLGAYCYLQRGTLKIFRALWIIPIAGLMMFALNGLRIFILVAIGHYWSPEAALNGFHTVGGWLNLMLVFIASLLALNYMPFFRQHSQSTSAFDLGDKALLTPLMAIIVGGLFVKVLSPDFAWLYPIPIMLAGFTLFYFRKCFFTFLLRPSFVSLAIGVVVFVVWIYLIPENPPQSVHFIEQLTAAPLWLAVLWLLCRVVGACLVLPLAEEFAFRGYLQPQLQVWLIQHGLKSLSVYLSLGVTALLFGYLHASFLAGAIAGLFYGLAYLQRWRLIDAVVAHAITNTLLAIDVIAFGHWSYW